MMSTVLLVDEDRAIRTLCNHVLTGCGVDILQAGGACEAIEVSNQYRGSIDLLLSDTLRCGFTGMALYHETVSFGGAGVESPGMSAAMLKPGIERAFQNYRLVNLYGDK